MQQYYTLEEAAGRLQMSADELREMAKSKKIRAFQDRGSWRFRAQEIEELARTRSQNSDAEVQLSDAPSPAPAKPAKAKPPANEDLLAVDFSLDKPASPSSKSGPRSPAKKAGDSDVRLVMDSNLDFQIDLDSDVRLEQSPPKRKSTLKTSDSGVKLVSDQPSDSDVKVVPVANDSDVKPRPGKNPSDSDIRLSESGRRKKSTEENVITEEVIDLDAEESKLQQRRSGEVRKPRVTQTASSGELPTTSPFELSEPDIGLDKPKKPKGRKAPDKKAEKDSASDFELVSFDHNKSPVDLGSGEIPMLVGDEDVDLGALGGPAAAGNSGINLRDPADSGISLEDEGSAEVEFELSLDSGVSVKTPKPAKQQPVVEDSDDSSSEFELSLDDAPTDDSSSEFELSLDDSGDSLALKDDSGSDSEFELTLDDDGGLSVEDEAKDIFEPTNFDVPALDEESGSEAVAIGDSDTDLEGSEFELSLDGGDSDSSTGSQVVALEDEEEADTGAATIARPRTAKPAKRQAAATVESEEAMDLDLNLDDSQPKKKPKKAAAPADTDEDDDEDSAERVVVPAEAAEWGPLPALILFPTVIVMFLVAIMGFELVQGMWSYQRPGSRASNTLIHPIAKPIAEAMDAKLPD